MRLEKYQQKLSEAKNLIGVKSGSWVVEQVLGYRLGKIEGQWIYKPDPVGAKDKGFYLQCKCKCGRKTEVRQGRFLSGNLNPCQRCKEIEDRMDAIVGQKFGQWIAIEHLGYKLPGGYSTTATGVKDRNQYALCQCSCGKLGIVNEAHLMAGRSTQCKSCAARNREKGRTQQHNPQS